MHRRKKFMIYPPDYQPGDGFEVRYSKLQALKEAVRMGDGASVDGVLYFHPSRGKPWTYSRQYTLIW